MAKNNFESLDDKEISTLEGSVENIIYANEDNGYTILELITDKNELITAVGVMPYVGEGENLQLFHFVLKPSFLIVTCQRNI